VNILNVLKGAKSETNMTICWDVYSAGCYWCRQTKMLVFNFAF